MTLWNTTGVKPACLRKPHEKCSTADGAHEDFTDRALFSNVVDWHARYDNQDRNLPTQDAKNHGPPEQIMVHQSPVKLIQVTARLHCVAQRKTTKTKYFA